jgi:hypothetical protein
MFKDDFLCHFPFCPIKNAKELEEKKKRSNSLETGMPFISNLWHLSIE